MYFSRRYSIDPSTVIIRFSPFVATKHILMYCAALASARFPDGTSLYKSLCDLACRQSPIVVHGDFELFGATGSRRGKNKIL